MHTVEELQNMKIEDVPTREASWNEVAADMLEAYDDDETAARAEHDREWVLYYDGAFYRELRARANLVAEDRLVDTDVLVEYFVENDWDIERTMEALVEFIESEIDDTAYWLRRGHDQELHLADL